MPQTTSSATTVFAIPTDTCYGLACDFHDALGYRKIHELKGRDPKKPFALVVERFEDIEKYARITPDQLDFLRNYPHPFTLLAEPIIPLPDFLDRQRYAFLGLRVAERCLNVNIRSSFRDLTGNLLKNDEIYVKTAYRSEPYDCTESEETKGLNENFAFCRDSLSFPLFLTSANRSAEPECFTREQVSAVFGSQVPILGERSGCHLPSDVFFFVGDTLERGYRRKNYG